MESLVGEATKIIHRCCLIYLYTLYLLYTRLSKIFQRILWLPRQKSSLLSITTAPSKIPNHMLVIVDRPKDVADYPAWIQGFLMDCWRICEEYGIGSLTLVDSANGSSIFLMELVKLAERKPITLYCNHKPISASVSPQATLHINVITENQRQFFVRQLSTIAADEPHFRFFGENLLSKMTRKTILFHKSLSITLF